MKASIIRYRVVLLVVLLMVASVGATGQTAAYRQVKAGNRAFNEKDYKEAERCYLKALHGDPRNARIHFNLGDTYLAQENGQEALKQFAEAAKTEPNKKVKAMAYHNMGYVHHKQKDYDKAIGYYKEALRNNPADEDTRYNLALCQKQKQDQQQQQQQQKQNQQEQKPNEDNRNKEEDPQQQEQSPDQMSQESTDQLLQLSRQAENQTRKKLQQMQPRKKSLPKNW